MFFTTGGPCLNRSTTLAEIKWREWYAGIPADTTVSAQLKPCIWCSWEFADCGPVIYACHVLRVKCWICCSYTHNLVCAHLGSRNLEDSLGLDAQDTERDSAMQEELDASTPMKKQRSGRKAGGANQWSTAAEEIRRIVRKKRRNRAFPPQTLVWAKLDNCPWWPARVCPSPPFLCLTHVDSFLWLSTVQPIWSDRIN